MKYWLVIGILVPQLCFAAIESREFSDPQHEARYFNLIDKLRCLVCQNQNLADSNAELAKDLRDKTYEMIVSGRTDEEITDFMVGRYGEFVLYEPPLNIHTLLLWFAPAILLLIGVATFIGVTRKKKKNNLEPVDADELARARELLERRND
jgi:cytochrome c-type biogenesis protein CcmH